MISEAYAGTEYLMTGSVYQVAAVLAFISLFYFLLLRPQQRRVSEHKALLEKIKVGSNVVTVGGFLGSITQIESDIVHVKLNEGVEVRIQKAAIESIVENSP